MLFGFLNEQGAILHTNKLGEFAYMCKLADHMF